MKHIREGRMGPPKTFKTGAVVGTYPKPMLVLELDPGGLDIVPPKSYHPDPKSKHIKMNIVAEDIVTVTPEEFHSLKEYLPKVLAVNFAIPMERTIEETYKITPDDGPFSSFISVANKVATMPTLPWKTIVIDPITELNKIILNHMAKKEALVMSDPRKWASLAGGKIHQIISVFTRLPCHTVFIFHSETRETGPTNEVITLPMVHSRFREQVGALLSQFFYTEINNGIAQVVTSPTGFVKGVGCRWPTVLPAKCGADFHSIYGKELTS